MLYHNDGIDPALWNRLAGANVFHRYEWRRVIESSYGLKPYFALAVEGDSFALYPSFLKGDRCVSMPFTYVCGYLFNCPKLQQTLEKSIHDDGYRESYRSLAALDGTESKVTGIIQVDDRAGYLGCLSHKMRHQIKKSQSLRLEFIETRNLESFYGLYCRKMHEHGTPPHKRLFFQSILDAFGESTIFATFHEGKPAAAMLCIEGLDAVRHERRTLHILWAASDSRWDRSYVNYFTYWSAIESAANRGVHFIDLGTARSGSTQHEFKSKWKPVFYGVHEHGAPSGDLAASAPMQALSAFWRHSPAWFANTVGPHLRKYIT